LQGPDVNPAAAALPQHCRHDRRHWRGGCVDLLHALCSAAPAAPGQPSGPRPQAPATATAPSSPPPPRRRARRWSCCTTCSVSPRCRTRTSRACRASSDDSKFAQAAVRGARAGCWRAGCRRCLNRSPGCAAGRAGSAARSLPGPLSPAQALARKLVAGAGQRGAGGAAARQGGQRRGAAVAQHVAGGQVPGAADGAPGCRSLRSRRPQAPDI
jgi:hypothetical protein